MRIIVVLAVQWGYPGDKPLRWFQISDLNHSGKRLIKLIGHNYFYVTNARSDIVYRASDQGTPDWTWLACNLKALNPDVILVCGSVAQATFHRNMVHKGAHVIELPHPAARNWTKAKIESARRRIARVLKSTSTEN